MNLANMAALIGGFAAGFFIGVSWGVKIAMKDWERRHQSASEKRADD